MRLVRVSVAASRLSMAVCLPVLAFTAWRMAKAEAEAVPVVESAEDLPPQAVQVPGDEPPAVRTVAVKGLYIDADKGRLWHQGRWSSVGQWSALGVVRAVTAEGALVRSLRNGDLWLVVAPETDEAGGGEGVEPVRPLPSDPPRIRLPGSVAP